MSDSIHTPTHVSDNKAAFQQVVRARRSFRRFLPSPVPEAQIVEILEDAQFSPSNCNTQPWDMHIVSGEKLIQLSKAMLAAQKADATSLDFTFDHKDFFGRYKERAFEQGKAYYQALGVGREDREGRARAAAMNFQFFGAPHVAMLFVPVMGDTVRAAADVGMYAQTFLLSLTAHGLGGIPQTSLGFYADTVREVLGIPENYKMLFGMSFGHPDLTATENMSRLGRDSIDQNVTIHS